MRLFRHPIRWLAVLAWMAGILWASAAQASPLYFDSVYPADTDIIVWDVTTAHPPEPGHPPDPGVPVEIISLSLTGAYLSDPNAYPIDPEIMPLPVRLVGSDSGGQTGTGTEARVDFYLDSPPPDDNLPAGTFIDIVALFEPSEDIFGSDSYNLGPVINLVSSDSFFDIFFETTTDLGLAAHMMHFEIGEGQSFTFSNTLVKDPLSPAFSLSFILDGGGVVDPANPLFTMTMTGEYTPVPEPATLLLLGLGLTGLVVWRKVQGEQR